MNYSPEFYQAVTAIFVFFTPFSQAFLHYIRFKFPIQK